MPTASATQASATIFLVLRRMRAPLIVLVLIFAVSVGGLSVIEGQDAEGNPVPFVGFDGKDMGKKVGDRMTLMIDPACEYNTFGDALKVGRACDEARFFWYEDPYSDGGLAAHAVQAGEDLRVPSVAPEGEREDHELSHQVRVTDGGLQGDAAAHRVAHHVGPSEAQVPDQGGHVVEIGRAHV